MSVCSSLSLRTTLGNFFRQAALPKAVRHWTMTTLREKLIKIGAKVVCHARLHHLPDGRGRDIEGVVRGHSRRIGKLRLLEATSG